MCLYRDSCSLSNGVMTGLLYEAQVTVLVDEVLRDIDLPIYQLNKQDGKINSECSAISIYEAVSWMLGLLRGVGKAEGKTMESEGSFFNPLCLGTPFDNVN